MKKIKESSGASAGRRRAVPVPLEPLSCSIKETKRITSLGETKIYELMKSGRLERTRIGGRTLISYRSIRRLVEGDAEV
jgi:Helix-turn-helix domain